MKKDVVSVRANHRAKIEKSNGNVSGNVNERIVKENAKGREKEKGIDEEIDVVPVTDLQIEHETDAMTDRVHLLHARVVAADHLPEILVFTQKIINIT